MKAETASVTINAPPQKVYKFVSNVANWPQFSEFARNIEPLGKNRWVAHTSQGDIIIETKFNKEFHLLDSYVVFKSGEKVFIPYRVVPNESGSELIMTNFQTPGDSDEAFQEQIEWMTIELENIKKLLSV